MSDSEYELRSYDSGGTLLDAEPLNVGAIENEGDGKVLTFFHLLENHPDRARLEVVRSSDGTTIASRSAGEQAPTVSVTSPRAGDVVDATMNVEWTARDNGGEHLRYVVRYSHDGGSTWSVLGSDLTETSLPVDLSNMPGGPSGIIEVIASDGIHSSTASVGPIDVARRVPQVKILTGDATVVDEASTTTGHQSESIVLQAEAIDAEDGLLTGSALQWQVNGPVVRTGSGEEILLEQLPPGDYDLVVTAIDSEGGSSSATTRLVIVPKLVGNGPAPYLDGYCDDPAYEHDPDPITLRDEQGNIAEGRFVHADRALHLCIGGLPLHDGDESMIVEIGLDGVPGKVEEAGVVRYEVFKNGLVRASRGLDPAEDLGLLEGSAAGISVHGPSWSAEMRIDEGHLGGWDRLVLLRAFHHWGQEGEGSESAWPGQSTAAPETWGLTALGGDVPNGGALSVSVDQDASGDGVRTRLTGSLSCPAGDPYRLAVEVSQGLASGRGTSTGTCGGEPQPFKTVVPTDPGPALVTGPVDACFTLSTGDPSAQLVKESIEVCAEVAVKVREQDRGYPDDPLRRRWRSLRSAALAVPARAAS